MLGYTALPVLFTIIYILIIYSCKVSFYKLTTSVKVLRYRRCGSTVDGYVVTHRH